MKAAMPFLIAPFLFVQASWSQPCVPESDSLALIEFFNVMNGSNWSNPWVASLPMDSLSGITLDSQRCVERLFVSDTMLVGQIPNLNLPHLKFLVLVNSTSDSIAMDTLPNFEKLNQLVSMKIHLGERLRGIVPDLDNLENLIVMDLSNNSLTGVSNSINLPNLHNLNLSNNKLVEVHDFSLPDLKTLNLSNNELVSVSNFDLPDLRNLYLLFNELVEVSDFDMPNLTILNLSINKLKVVPDFDLPSLTNLDLSNNDLEEVPDFNLPTLTLLRLSNNDLIEVPDFSNLTELVELHLVGNKLEQTPSFIFPNLTRLDLEKNQLVEMPILSNLLSIKRIDLSHNRISGEIPDFGLVAPSIERIFLNNNLFDACTELQLSSGLDSIVKVGHNRLTFDDLLLGNNHEFIYYLDPQDTIPVNPTFTQTTNGSILIHLGFDDNVDSSTYQWFKDDTILVEETNTNVLEVGCEDYPLTDSFHVTVTNSTAIGLYGDTLTLITNKFTINDVEDREALMKFFRAMNGTNWSDSIKWDTLRPVCTWYGVTLNTDRRVEKLEIKDDNLMGQLPDLNLPFLKVLSLINESGNSPFAGSLPNFSMLNQLARMVIRFGEGLMGELPDFDALDSLQYLDLSNNALMDEVSDFSNLHFLDTLLLGHNDLSGQLPNFSNLPSIKAIDLSHNQLTGVIPNFDQLPPSINSILPEP